MKFSIHAFLLLSLSILNCKGQCTCNFNFTGIADTISFINQSTVDNAHYYWNFGDGDGSNELSPSHVYPANGKYLVTLYAHDTILDCSNFNQLWLTVEKPDSLICDLKFSSVVVPETLPDSSIEYFLQITNISENCEELNPPAQSLGVVAPCGVPIWSPAKTVK